MPNGRRFAPILIATVTPRDVETREGAKGAYTVMTGAVVSRSGKKDLVRTVMAFGEPNRSIAGMLSSGVPVSLALRHDGGTMKVVGLPRTAATTADCEEIIVSILQEAGLDEDMSRTAYLSMMHGSSDRPSEDCIDLDPDMMERIGHVLLPILDAGIPFADAMDAAERIVASDAAQDVEDAGLSIRQDAARAFLGL